LKGFQSLEARNLENSNELLHYQSSKLTEYNMNTKFPDQSTARNMRLRVPCILQTIGTNKSLTWRLISWDQFYL